ncbi:MAG: DEAD/DEAH box helicase [Polyangiaceae bacterium]
MMSFRPRRRRPSFSTSSTQTQNNPETQTQSPAQTQTPTAQATSNARPTENRSEQRPVYAQNPLPQQSQNRNQPGNSRSAQGSQRPQENRPQHSGRPQNGRPQNARSNARPEFSRRDEAPRQARPQHRDVDLTPRAAPLPPKPMTPEIAEAVEASPFTALGLTSSLVRAVLTENYVQPSPVQQEVIPSALAGRDILAQAQTGTGKTAAFVLPILQRLAAEPGVGIQALILTPTRELALQIADRVAVYGRHLNIRHAVIYGGVSQKKQENSLQMNPSIVVATPGRLLDLMRQGYVRLDHVTHFVLDEADRMLDMGFVHDVRRVTVALPAKRQTLFFSATMPSAVEGLSKTMLQTPVRVSITPKITTAEKVSQSVVFVARTEKQALLKHLLDDKAIERAIVFTRTKRGANKLCEQLDRAGIGSAAIHGNKSQGQRERALEGFKLGTTRILVATDLAARGIDVNGISLVVNYELPDVAEQYVHRIGRTGRAGASGRAISFCDASERPLLVDIERLIKQRLPVEAFNAPTTQSPVNQSPTVQSTLPSAP